MFGLFRKKQTRLMPEAFWNAVLDEATIRVTDQNGDTQSVVLDQLSGVAIETNDSGPWGADVWWLLFGSDDQLACAFPQGATGEKEIIDYISSLPGFRHDEMIKAMGCTENAIFPAWRRTAE